MINTATGPIPAESLGRTLIHEHFCFAYPGWTADITMAPLDSKAVLEAGLQAIASAKAVGIQTIVDPTPNDTGGRDPLLYRELSKRTGINIICTTGLYTQAEGSPAYWQTKAVWGTDICRMISDLMIREISEGIGTTGVKAGAIKVGSSTVMTDYEKAVHAAAVIAQKETGVPIITHTEGTSGGQEQAEFLLQWGADPNKTMIGHANNSGDIGYHRAILNSGVRIGFDRLGLGPVLNVADTVSAQNIATLCSEGFTEKILLSHDTVNFWLGRPAFPEFAQAMLKDWKIDYISKEIVPMLRAQGLSEKQIDTIMIDNPRNLFLGQ